MKSNDHPGSDAKYKWREVPRKEPSKRSVSERVADFFEVYRPYDEKTVQEQASRCVQCPEPSCAAGWPLEGSIPQWLALTAEGKFLEASRVMLSGSSVPEVCCRLGEQDRTSEEACVLSATSEAVPIGAIGRFLLDYAVSHEVPEAMRVEPNGFKVAVLGSGPSGLVCAEELSRRGYEVTVFDCHDVPAGLLSSGVSAFKLDKTLLNRRIEILQRQGVQFRLGTACGEGLNLGQLRRDYDAVFYGLCGDQPRPLEVPGAECRGVYQALPFILQQHTTVPLESGPIEVRGKEVVVLGGGDTAMDCLRTAIRCGATKVTCLYRRDQAHMPADPQEYENAREEGAHFVFSSQVESVQANPVGEVAALRCQRTQLTSEESAGSRAVPVQPVPGSEFDLPAEVVLVAYGFRPPILPQAGGFDQLEADDQGVLKVDSHQMTNLPGVFAGGSAVYGYGHLVEAVREARTAALAIDKHLQNQKTAE